MKTTLLYRLWLVLCLCVAMGTARGQVVSIPDQNFASWLDGHSFPISGNSTSGYFLNASDPLVINASSIDCESYSISNLDGIQYFTHLQTLNCSNNHLAGLPTLSSTVKYLILSHNYFTTLPALSSGLITLDCSYNPLHTLSSFPSSLKYLTCNHDSLNNLSQLSTSLLELDCTFNQLTSLPALPTHLQTLACGFNPVTALPSLPASLTSLSCMDASLTTTPSLPTALTFLSITSNHVTVLPALPDSLRTFDCSFNSISVLPALPPYLNRLDCSYNTLSTIPALPVPLQTLYCHSNHITVLPALSDSLQTFWCQKNLLSALPALPDPLTELECDYNSIASLPALPPHLHLLTCSKNNLSALPSLPASLTLLGCGSNRLTTLPDLPIRLNEFACDSNPSLTCLPRIYSPPLYSFFIAGTNIHCLPNLLTAIQYDINPATMPLCDAASGCDFYYNVAGTVHSDTSATCTSDSIHPGASITNMKVQLKQAGSVIQQFYTFNSGGYSFKTPGYGSYTVDIDTTALPLSIVCPSSMMRSVVISAADSVKKYESFGAQCSGIDFGVYNLPAPRFRPGFQTGVHISAGNVARLRYNIDCGAGTAGTVTTTWTNALHYIGPASGALTPSSVSGNIVTYNLADLNILEEGDLDIILLTDPSAILGTTACLTITITPTIPDLIPANNTLTQCFQIRNSYDPNLKDVYPENIQPGATDWLTYTIHFQNTGSDTAYLVVLKDTLSQYIDAASFQYLASSHHAVIQLDHNAMTFTFPHINLVDSATNPPLSEGWIQYRVKANANLTNGTAINNTAYIYFDNNPAVVTNTVTTTVAACVNTTTPISHAMCAGDTFTFYIQHLTASGIYADTFQVVGGCDSIINLTLTVKPSASQTINVTAFNAAFYIFGGDTLRNAGTYYDTLPSVNGCDSTITLHLSFGVDGVHDITGISDIHLYPNPNTGSFTLQTSNSHNSNYIITDMLGEVIEEKAITSDTQAIDMRDAAAGVYTLTVKGMQSSRQVRFTMVR
ncbi:MAG: Adhesin AidA-related protein [Bacteroidetes bacterium]|nr:Adhesin AidA-related protein [Bacteroidota bacterium]